MENKYAQELEEILSNMLKNFEFHPNNEFHCHVIKHNALSLLQAFKKEGKEPIERDPLTGKLKKLVNFEIGVDMYNPNKILLESIWESV